MLANKSMILTLVLLLSSSSNATLINISVETDKAIYHFGEDIFINVTAFNQGPQNETLTFTDSIHASYAIDSIYNWADGKISQPYGSVLVLEPGNSKTWSFTHTAQQYSLGPGAHSISGEVWAVELIGGTSGVASITIVPEPLTLSLLTLGVLFIRRK
jgi:hypothetical protein